MMNGELLICESTTKKDFTLLKMYRLKCLTLQFVTIQGGLSADPHEKEPNEKDCKCKNYD